MPVGRRMPAPASAPVLEAVARAMRAAGWVIAVCVLAATLGWWTKAHCLVDGGWQDVEQYTRWCYTDVYPLWRAEELDKGAVPYFDHEVEYPVLTGAQMYLGQQAVRLLGGGGVRFYTVTSLINGAAALATLLALAATGLPRRRLLWWTAVPTFIVYVTLNWDPVAVLLLTLAVLAHLRGRNALAGVAAGLGVAAKATPGVVIPFIALGLLRARRVRAALVHVGAAALAWTLCNVGIAVAAPEGWLEFFRLNRRRPADFDSLWYLAEQLRGARFDVATLNLVSGALVLAGWAVIAVIGSRRRRPCDTWALALPALVWFLLANKVYSPQYSLWLLPLMALSLRRLAPFAAFCVADLTVFAVRFPWFGHFRDVERSPSDLLFAAVLLVRAAVLLWILVESTLDHDPTLTVSDSERRAGQEHEEHAATAAAHVAGSPGARPAVPDDAEPSAG